MQNDIKRSGIYCIENIITNKKYVGQSVNIYNRWHKHISELNRGLHYNDYLQKAWDKYGKENFKFYVLEYCSVELLNEREIYYIDYYHTMDKNSGYNLKSGGQEHCFYTEEYYKILSNAIKQSFLNPERRELQRLNAIKQWSDPKIKEKIMGKNNGMYGKYHTDEAKKKMSEARKGVSSSRRNTTPVLCVELNREFKDATEAAKKCLLIVHVY